VDAGRGGGDAGVETSGLGAQRIAREFGTRPKMARRYLCGGCWTGYSRAGRPAALAGKKVWLEERLVRHGGNVGVVRQELASQLGISVSLRTVERACMPLRQRLLAETRATMRFETPPGVSCSSILVNVG
jgi:hypothetical protein